MKNTILILGESGTGKSTSISTLPSAETFVLNVLGKPLPFRGYKTSYTRLSDDGLTGNYFHTDDSLKILRLINGINERRPDIKYLVLDDFSCTITNGFMRKAMQKGYDKFSELGSATFDIIEAITHERMRDDLYCFVVMHTDIDNHGRYKPKTIGKMIDQYIDIACRFTNVFHALIVDGQYRFLTNNDGIHMAKTPRGMFAEPFIDNDLQLIVDTIAEYEF